MTIKLPLDRSRAFRMRERLSVWPSRWAPAQHTDDDVAAEAFPTIIASVIRSPIEEANRSVVIFVGQARAACPPRSAPT